MDPARRVRFRAPAKLNLGLHILARRPDGYHDIETLFVPLRLFDELELERVAAPGVRIEVTRADSPAIPADASNLAVRGASDALDALGSDAGVRIRLEKRIPVAAGLGGGSSDAAAAILGVEALLDRELPPAQKRKLARGIGADVPFFLDPRPAVGRGVGDRLEPLSGVPEAWWVLAALPFEVSTPEIYRAASAELTLPREASSIAALLGPAGLTSPPINDLETVCARRHPAIGEARRALETVGASFTGMSGSGPTVYGRFESQAQALEAARCVALPDGGRAIATSSPGSEAGDWGWGVAKW